MRITAYEPIGRSIRLVWECERCVKLTEVVWVDDETNEYATSLYMRGGDSFLEDIIKCKKIVIDLQALIVYINPLDLGESDELCTSLSIENNSQSSINIPTEQFSTC